MTDSNSPTLVAAFGWTAGSALVSGVIGLISGLTVLFLPVSEMLTGYLVAIAVFGGLALFVAGYTYGALRWRLPFLARLLALLAPVATLVVYVLACAWQRHIAAIHIVYWIAVCFAASLVVVATAGWFTWCRDQTQRRMIR